MSYNWCFHSFDYRAFKHALSQSRQKVVDDVIGEITEFGDYPQDEVRRYERIGERIVSSGFSYDGCDEADTKIMDRFIFDMFHTFGDEISFEPESSEFLSPYASADLPSHLYKKHFWSRPKPIETADREYFYLPFFTHLGRRLGQSEPSECEYVALEPAEVLSLRREIEKFLATPEGKALDASYDENLSRDFLEPVRSVLKKRKALHAQVS